MHVTGQIFENLIDITAYLLVTGEIGQIGVNLCRDRMIIASSKMRVGDKAPGLTPDDG